MRANLEASGLKNHETFSRCLSITYDLEKVQSQHPV